MLSDKHRDQYVPPYWVLLIVCPFQGDVDAAVKQLLELKAQYKTAAGTDWKPGQAPAPQPAASQGGAASLNDQITDQGTLVRDLKTRSEERRVGKECV